MRKSFLVMPQMHNGVNLFGLLADTVQIAEKVAEEHEIFDSMPHSTVRIASNQPSQ
jgi:hypothetical protein